MEPPVGLWNSHVLEQPGPWPSTKLIEISHAERHQMVRMLQRLVAPLASQSPWQWPPVLAFEEEERIFMMSASRTDYLKQVELLVNFVRRQLHSQTTVKL